MGSTVPALSLTHGQVLWAVSRGSTPNRRLVDQLRYLRRLGVPFRKGELGTGRGNRLRYDFEQLIETGVGVWALERGMSPREVATFLIRQRKFLRLQYRKAFEDQPERVTQGEWAKSRGQIIAHIEDELLLRLHDRYSEAPGKIESLGPSEVKSLADLFVLAEKYPGQKARTLLPLTRLVIELVAWAQVAPELKPGP